MPDPLPLFAQRLRALREEANLTGNALAVLSGLDASFVRSLDRGEKSPSLETAQRLAKALGEALGRRITTADFGEE